MAQKQYVSVTCSVCIANYNGLSTIDSCIQSVLDQDCAFGYEIIVHDDASTDGSGDYIARRYPSVSLIRSHENVGYCISNNRMVETARGHYVLLLNNDAMLEPDALRVLHAAAVSSEQPTILSLRQYNAADGQLIDMGYLLDPFLNPVPCRTPKPELAMAIGACLWIPVALWRQIGGFPPWLHTLAEDMYLCLAARLLGYRVQVPALSGFRHWVGSSLGGGKVQSDGRLRSTVRRRALSERNKNSVMFVCYPLPVLALVLPVHMVLLLIEGAALALLRRDRTILRHIYFKSIRSLWRNWGTLTAARRHLQRQRVTSIVDFFSVFTLVPHKLRLLLRHGLPEVAR